MLCTSALKLPRPVMVMDLAEANMSLHYHNLLPDCQHECTCPKVVNIVQGQARMSHSLRNLKGQAQQASLPAPDVHLWSSRSTAKQEAWQRLRNGLHIYRPPSPSHRCHLAKVQYVVKNKQISEIINNTNDI